MDRYVNERGGYALLLPRGWEGERDGPQTLIRSFDRLVAISIAPGPIGRAAGTPIEDYATNTAERCAGSSTASSRRERVASAATTRGSRSTEPAGRATGWSRGSR